MIDKYGKKYLVIRFVENYDMEEQKESDWSLVEDNEEFAYTNWFSYNDYEVYRPYELKEKFFSKSTKLSEKKLQRYGYLKVEGSTYDWAYDWFFSFLKFHSLKEYFSNLDKKEREIQFWKFADIVDIREEIYIIENWLRLDLAKKWCEKHDIEYKIEVPVEYPQELAKREIRKGIREKIRDTKFKEPFGFLNH